MDFDSICFFFNLIVKQIQFVGEAQVFYNSNYKHTRLSVYIYSDVPWHKFAWPFWFPSLRAADESGSDEDFMVEDDDDSDYGHSKKRSKKVIRRGRLDKKEKKSPKPRLKATGERSVAVLLLSRESHTFLRTLRPRESLKSLKGAEMNGTGLVQYCKL